MKTIDIKYVKKLHPIFTKPKRIKIVVGGRGSTKSTAVADYVIACMTQGQLWCCAREFQNSIDESVHRNIEDEIMRLGIGGFDILAKEVAHYSGGRNFYKGLARNITSLKSTLSGIDGLWIEEGEDLSAKTLRVLTASVRLNATDTERLIAGEEIKMPEVIITMNRGSRSDPISEKYLKRAESSLERCGYYEDEEIMVVEVNYTDMPKSWFEGSGLEVERASDEDHLSDAEYAHKWLGRYIETVDDPIIQEKWFEACVDAHKIEHLKRRFKPTGKVVASHDPSGTGDDNKGYALRHGSIIKRAAENLTGDVDDGFDWALDLAIEDCADWFVYDADGMGSGAKRQVSDALRGRETKFHGFRGSLSGSAQDNADDVYLPIDDHKEGGSKTYKDEFLNNRAQYYIGELARRMENTYRCVVKDEYFDADDMISFDSDGIENINRLRSEMCRIPRKRNGRGLKQVLSKDEMKKLGIDSPGMADSIMMTMFMPPVERSYEPIEYPEMSIV